MNKRKLTAGPSVVMRFTPTTIMVLLSVAAEWHSASGTKRPGVVTSGTTVGPSFVRVTSKPTAKCPNRGRAFDNGKVSL